MMDVTETTTILWLFYEQVRGQLHGLMWTKTTLSTNSTMWTKIPLSRQCMCEFA